VCASSVQRQKTSFLRRDYGHRPHTNFSEQTQSEGLAGADLPVIGQSGQTRRFYSSDFSHPISTAVRFWRKVVMLETLSACDADEEIRPCS
jgi:hypothetical protein